MVNHTLDAYGALHYAVNNAGIGGAQAPAGETDLADWARVININLNGVLYGMRYQVPAMLKAGAAECAIVNMASILGTVGATATEGKSASPSPGQGKAASIAKAPAAKQGDEKEKGTAKTTGGDAPTATDDNKPEDS